MRNTSEPRIGPMNRKSAFVDLISASSILSTSECNIYRVAKYRSPWPFSSHDLTRPRSLKYPRPEARPRPQSGRACAARTGQPWSHGQGRKRQICGVFGFTRENSECSRSRPRRALRQALNPNVQTSYLSRPWLWPSCILTSGNFQ